MQSFGKKAKGVCIICCLAFCSECAGWVNNVFLCAIHEGYEIYEGMARVFGTSDEALAQHVLYSLEHAGLHPFIYSRMMRITGKI